MGLALDWIELNITNRQQVCIITDSQSLCQAIPGDDPELDQLRSRLRNTNCPLTIQWCPGHAGVAGNELADAAAKQATELQAPPPLSVSTVSKRK